MQVIHGIKTGPSISINRPAKGGNTALVIKKHFPDVKTVSDSLQAVSIDVTQRDCKNAKAQEFTECAFAIAACRCHKAKAAYIGIKTSYLVFDGHAIRFHTPVTVQREITSFDRHDDFAPGKGYRLSPVAPSQRLGQPGGHSDNAKKKFKRKRNGGFMPIRPGTARIRSE